MIKNVCFIGSGKLASQLITGFKRCDKFKLSVTSPHCLDKDLAIPLTQRYQNNIEAMQNQDVILIAVKPDKLLGVCEEMKATLKNSQVVISLAAGLTADKISTALPINQPLLRAMPNIAASIGLATTALYASPTCDDEQKRCAKQLFDSLGLSLWLDNEKQINAATAIAGSGPAFVFSFIDAMIQAGVDLGLPQALSEALSLQTAHGAIALSKTSSKPLESLIAQVCSKGGTTEAGLKSLEKNNMTAIIKEAVLKAHERAESLSLST